MPESVYNLYDQSALSQLVDRVCTGEEIVIAKNGVPLAKLVPISRPARRPGGWEGKVRIREDFDDPLPPEIQAAFEGNT